MKTLISFAALAFLVACGQGGVAMDSSQREAAMPSPAVASDPSQNGPYQAADEDYDFGRVTLSDPETGDQFESDIHGYIRYPENAAGPFPVLLFQHGRHQTCETGVGQIPVPVGDDNCPDLTPVLHPAQSYRGYDYLAENLASHGYAVLSIDTNDVNDNDSAAGSGDTGALARASLILTHLDAFRDINRAGGQGFDHLNGKLDFSQVGIMGHSRGGEGVNRTVQLNREQAEPHNLKAVFALAPTDYMTQDVSGVPFATLLPYCDGDVEDLMGAFAFDNARYKQPHDNAPKFQIVAMGANHNYFNTVWTSDDWTIHGTPTDSHCGMQSSTNARDTPEEQRALGLFFMASFFRYFVGGEPDFRGYWMGDVAVPASACPASGAPCDERYLLSIQPGQQQYQLIDAVPSEDSLQTNALGLAVEFDGFSAFGFCRAEGRSGQGCAVSEPTFATAGQLYLQWDELAIYKSDLGGVDARAFDDLSLRIGISLSDENNAGGQNFGLRLTDTRGQQATLMAGDFSHALTAPPGDPFASGGSAKTTLNAVRFPLGAFSGVDLGRLQTLELLFGGTEEGPQLGAGTVQIADLMFQKAGPTPY